MGIGACGGVGRVVWHDWGAVRGVWGAGVNLHPKLIRWIATTPATPAAIAASIYHQGIPRAIVEAACTYVVACAECAAVAGAIDRPRCARIKARLVSICNELEQILNGGKIACQVTR